MAGVVSARLNEDLLARLDAARGDASRGAWVTDLVTRELSAAPAAPAPAQSASGTLVGGIPCPGVACSHPGCWARDTRRYGNPDDFGGLVLCPAHAADAVGQEYRRPPSAALRAAVRRSAA